MYVVLRKEFIMLKSKIKGFCDACSVLFALFALIIIAVFSGKSLEFYDECD